MNNYSYVLCSDIDDPKPVIIPPKDPPGGGLPAGGEPGQILVIDDDGNPAWAAGGGGGGSVTLYNETGQSTTGGMTQKAITDNLDLKASQTALNALSTTVGTKASQADLEALETTVGGKADQSDVESLSGIVTSLRGDVESVSIKVDNLEPIVDGKADKSYVNSELAKKQNLLVAGDNITLTPDAATGTVTISAEGGSGDDTFVAEYGVTTSQELIAYLDSTKEPFAPILVKRGNTYYTAVISTPGTDRVNLSTFGTISGEGYLFNYTVTGSNWASSNIGFQTKLVSGTSIKTINGESILGSGNIDIQGGVTVDDALSETSLNPVQNQVITNEFNSAIARIAALEAKLADFEETRLQMTDGTNTVDKVVLTKPYAEPTPQTVFDLDDGVYAADGTFLGALTRGAEATNDIYETNDIIRTVNMTQIMTKYPTATGMVISGVTMGQNSVTGVTSGQLDWVCLKFSDEIYGPLAEHGTVPDWVSTIYVPATMESPFEPWGLTAATVNKTGTPLPWA